GVYENAPHYIEHLTAEWNAARSEAERRRRNGWNRPPDRQSGIKSIAEFRIDARYGGDGNRVDLAYAVYALAHGASEHQVRAAIGSRDLSHKGNQTRQT